MKHIEKMREKQRQMREFNRESDQIIRREKDKSEVQEERLQERKREMREKIEKSLSPYRKRAAESRDRQLLAKGNPQKLETIQEREAQKVKKQLNKEIAQAFIATEKALSVAFGS